MLKNTKKLINLSLCIRSSFLIIIVVVEMRSLKIIKRGGNNQESKIMHQPKIMNHFPILREQSGIRMRNVHV